LLVQQQGSHERTSIGLNLADMPEWTASLNGNRGADHVPSTRSSASSTCWHLAAEGENRYTSKIALAVVKMREDDYRRALVAALRCSTRCFLSWQAFAQKFYVVDEDKDFQNEREIFDAHDYRRGGVLAASWLPLLWSRRCWNADAMVSLLSCNRGSAAHIPP
uniref:Glyco_transf_7C domain-containing protein n=1 Tax=Macrostomum lignano TaxID=282301 RepID=A0A1I8F820_9PLAT